MKDEVTERIQGVSGWDFGKMAPEEIEKQEKEASVFARFSQRNVLQFIVFRMIELEEEAASTTDAAKKINIEKELQGLKLELDKIVLQRNKKAVFDEWNNWE